ncbi:MAG: bifunctional DNA-binding transcriptional regulator/O6-methylguanine-DNA methyltransferase Ada [Gemmatimonadota bacterium]
MSTSARGGMPPAGMAWRAVVERDPSLAGRFVYAVSTTGIYCRPGCSSRTPRRENVDFYPSPKVAEAAGYRPCKRCRPRGERASSALRSVRAACAYLDEHVDETVTLEELARVVHVSPFHLQRTFKRYVGLTPRQYLEVKRADRLREQLRDGETVSRAAFEAGYSSSSRVYEQADAHLGMTPGAYQAGGRGMRIRYATAATPVGRVLVAATERGVCAVSLGEDETGMLADLRREYPAARIEAGEPELSAWIEAVVAFVEGRTRDLAIPLDVQATTFQWRVWRVLQEIPYGSTRTYGDVAAAIGKPGAARAVARACARNRAALVIPCHRVVPGKGGAGGYRWGQQRKRQLLEMESASLPVEG